MKNLYDYLAEKLQEAEFKARIASNSYQYWEEKALKGMTPEEMEREIKEAQESGFYA